jgi:putative transposase
MLGAMLYVLRTGIQWNALPRALGASTTVYDRFRRWEADGLFQRMWAAGLKEFDELVGIDWEWQSLDGVMTKAPFGGAATGRNPTDRGKRGTKRSQLSEGHGLPLAIAVAGANVHDTNLVTLTLEAVMVEQPADEGRQHLCLDAGYAGERTSAAVTARGYVPHVRPRHEDKAHARSADPTQRPRRWVVERLHSWLNRSRRLLVRWEKLQRTYEAFLHLACALICFQQCYRAMAAQVSE